MNTAKALKKIIICDDHPIVLQGLSAILTADKGFEISTVVQSGQELMAAMAQFPADIVLIDAHLKNEFGFDLISKIHAYFHPNPSPNIFIITSYLDDYMLAKALQSGATGCISKSMTAEEFIHAIKFPKMNPKDASPSSPAEEAKRNGVALLTHREKDIIFLMTQGMGSKKIAEQLSISNYTVETHKKNIFRKLQFKSAAELSAWYYANKDYLPSFQSEFPE